MKRTTLLLAFLTLALVASAFLMTAAAGARPTPGASSTLPKPGPTVFPPKPDLVITNFGLMSWGACTPGQTVFTFSVGVKNQGNASWSGAEPALSVRDLHPGVLDNWGTAVGIDPPLAPGAERTFQVAIGYYSGNPTHMTLGQPHPFQATVNPNHVVQESNFTNNAGPGPAVWNGVRVIMVGAPEACTKLKPGMPTTPPRSGS